MPRKVFGFKIALFPISQRLTAIEFQVEMKLSSALFHIVNVFANDKITLSNAPNIDNNPILNWDETLVCSSPHSECLILCCKSNSIFHIVPDPPQPLCTLSSGGLVLLLKLCVALAIPFYITSLTTMHSRVYCSSHRQLCYMSGALVYEHDNAIENLNRACRLRRRWEMELALPGCTTAKRTFDYRSCWT